MLARAHTLSFLMILAASAAVACVTFDFAYAMRGWVLVAVPLLYAIGVGRMLTGTTVAVPAGVSVWVCAQLALILLWPSVSPATARAASDACGTSYCVTLGTRVALDASNCAAHAAARSSAESDDSAAAGLCVARDPERCTLCGGACVPQSTCTAEQLDAAAQMRESAASLPDDAGMERKGDELFV